MKPMGSRPDPLAALIARLQPLLRKVLAGTEAALRAAAEKVRAVDWSGVWKSFREDHRPLREKLRSAAGALMATPRLQALRDGLWKARTWAMLHDTVPREATARRREWSMARQQRHEQREVERQQRKEEQSKKREKKDEEERQAYSVYFE